MESPLVSIVIPVYNGANYMRTAIDSALAQTYPNIEIIVVNDGSSDDGQTERIALSYGDKIRYFYKENGGCASALNYGISKMKGDFLSWLSHDDVYSPDKIQKQMDYIQEHKLDEKRTVISCNIEVINHVGKKLRKCVKASGYLDPEQSFRRCVIGGSFNGCSLLIPKPVIDDIGAFGETYTYILDQVYWTEIALAGYSYYHAEEILVYNRRHGEQVSVKKQALLDTETDRFTENLYSRIFKDGGSVFNQKILYYFCAQTGRKKLAQQMKKELQQQGHFSFGDRVKVLKMRVKRSVRKLARKVYRKLTIR